MINKEMIENSQTCEELFKEDHTTIDYLMKYCTKVNLAAEKCDMTLKQGLDFLEALYRNDENIVAKREKLGGIINDERLE